MDVPQPVNAWHQPRPRPSAPDVSPVGLNMQPYVILLRPAQWIKNGFVFAALIFGHRRTDPEAIVLAVAAFVCFCLASSAGYVLNDIMDRERDRLHPVKKNRPIASGVVSPSAGVAIALLLLAVDAAIMYLYLNPLFGLTVAGYLALTFAYSLKLKNVIILDVIIIAVLFVLRALGGAYAITVPVSPWLLVCTFMLCLFLGFGKRRCEIAMIGDGAAIKGHRPTLERYTPHLLTHLLSTSAGVAIITFLLYTLDSSAQSFANKQELLYTLPLVVYGIYRYVMLIERGQATGPTDLIINDKPFLITLLLWGLIAMAILYHPAAPPASQPAAQASNGGGEPV